MRDAQQGCNFFKQVQWLWLSLGVIIIDQLTKAFVTQHHVLYQPRPLMPFITIMLTHNTGAAFSLLGAAAGWQRWLFMLIALASSIVIIYFLVRSPRLNHWTAAGLALILGGALGNFYDRWVLGYVIDFIDLHIGTVHFPAYFNLADVAINVGVLLWLIGAISKPKEGTFL